jgi:hypothetical protein
MPILKLNSEEVSFLKMCVALVLGGIFQNKVAEEKITNIIKSRSGELEVLYSKLEYPQHKKKADKKD